MSVPEKLIASIKEATIEIDSTVSKTYLELVEHFSFYPLHTEEDLRIARSVAEKISTFIKTEPACDEGIRYYFRMLTSIISIYEKEKTSSELENNVMKRTEQIRRLVSELSITEERQRRSIASDLHDHVGQTLSMIKIKLQELQGNNIFTPVYESAGEIRLLIDQTIAYTRSLTIELSPPVLYELGFDSSIEWLVGQVKKKHPKIKVILQNDRSQKNLSDDLKITLYRSVNEIIQNVVKHADATYIIIDLKLIENNMIVSINDNGRGFNVAVVTEGTSKTYGLFSIKERLSYFGGVFKIESKLGGGTKVIITVSVL
jgi:signal transduction histidine kinase